MKIIAEKKWSYVLFDDGTSWVLTLLIGGVVEIDVSIRLTHAEIEEIQKDTAYVEKIVEAVKHNRGKFASREINPPVWP